MPPSLGTRCGLYVSYEQEKPLAVTYQLAGRTNKTLERWKVEIEMEVQLSIAGIIRSKFITFRIDTGAQLTIIPRALVPGIERDRAFSRPIIDLYGIEDQSIKVHLFEANLYIPVPPASGGEMIRLGTQMIGVPVSEKPNKALLGLDALRKVVMISDPEHVTFWRL